LKDAFTLIELLVVVTIVAIIGSLIISFSIGASDSGEINPYFNPQAANAQANQRMVNEIAEQNRLMRELLNKQGNK